MAVRPEFGLTKFSAARLLASAAFSCVFVCGSAAAAAEESESLEEEFLLFLSDWSDTSGEFVAPSEVEAMLPDEDKRGHSAPDQGKRNDEAEEGSDSDD